ncbi:MAG TPA: hypothetical protein VJM08_01410 [Anaerolineales bacterium]|nr:hypothetical protein [Anaerolineales bacterium]
MSNAEAAKREAIISVLAKLGAENLASLKSNLKDYAIDLDKDDLFTLEELQLALQRFLGPNGAGLLLGEIQREISNLTEPTSKHP